MEASARIAPGHRASDSQRRPIPKLSAEPGGHTLPQSQELVLLERVSANTSARGDLQGSIMALRRCLELARRELFRGELDDPMRAVLIFSRKHGETLAKVGAFTDAEGVLREALDLAGPADIDRARVLEGLARVARARERLPEASTLLREAIATAGRSGARELLASLHALESEWRPA